MLKLAALGALGYFGYQYYQKNQTGQTGQDARIGSEPVAGGPLSSQSALSDAPDTPPM